MARASILSLFSTREKPTLRTLMSTGLGESCLSQFLKIVEHASSAVSDLYVYSSNSKRVCRNFRKHGLWEAGWSEATGPAMKTKPSLESIVGSHTCDSVVGRDGVPFPLIWLSRRRTSPAASWQPGEQA